MQRLELVQDLLLGLAGDLPADALTLRTAQLNWAEILVPVLGPVDGVFGPLGA
jgi:hypothetical protein